MSDPKQRKTILLLVAPLAIIPLLFTYLVLQTPPSLISDVSATSLYDEEYIKKIYLTISNIESMSEKSSQLGLEILVSDYKISEVVSKIRELQNQLSEEKSNLDQLKIPSNFATAHPYLVKSLENMQNSNELLISAFEKFEEIRDGNLSMFMLTSFLGSDQTSLSPLYNVLLINQEEKLLIEEARELFADSIKESSAAKDNLDIFISKSGIDFGNVKLTESAKNFGIGSGGCAACKLPLDVIKSIKI